MTGFTWQRTMRLRSDVSSHRTPGVEDGPLVSFCDLMCPEGILP